jgi:hypothetical protein
MSLPRNGSYTPPSSPVPAQENIATDAPLRTRGLSFFGRLRSKTAKPKEEEYEPQISSPFNTRHLIHVDFDIETGLSGMPEDMDTSTITNYKVGKDSVSSPFDDTPSNFHLHEDLVNRMERTRGPRNSIVPSMTIKVDAPLVPSSKTPEKKTASGMPATSGVETNTPETTDLPSPKGKKTFRENYPHDLTVRPTCPVPYTLHLCDFINTRTLITSS